MRIRAPKTRAPTAYTETIYKVGSVKLTFQIGVVGPDAHQARDAILRSIARYLAEDPTVRSLMAEDPEKGNAFLGGLTEVVNGLAYAEAWEGDAGEIAARILRESSRRGMNALYLSSGRSSMDASLA